MFVCFFKLKKIFDHHRTDYIIHFQIFSFSSKGTNGPELPYSAQFKVGIGPCTPFPTQWQDRKVRGQPAPKSCLFLGCCLQPEALCSYTVLGAGQVLPLPQAGPEVAFCCDCRMLWHPSPSPCHKMSHTTVAPMSLQSQPVALVQAGCLCSSGSEPSVGSSWVNFYNFTVCVT